MQEVSIKNGKLHGSQKKYYENGQLSEEKIYKNGVLIEDYLQIMR